MLWLQILIVSSTAMLFAVALVLWRRHAAATSSTPPTERRKILAALALLAIGAVFWLVTEVDMPSVVNMQSAWPLSILLGLLAVLVAARPRTGRLVILVTAVVAPVLAIAGLALIDAVRSGVPDESFGKLAIVAVMGTAVAYTAPAVVTSALLRPRAARAAIVPPG